MPRSVNPLRFVLCLLAVLAVAGCAPLPAPHASLGETPTAAPDRVGGQAESLCDTRLGTMPEEMSGFPDDGGGSSLFGCS